MSRVNLEQFKERIEQGKGIPALLLLGEEFYLRDACRAALIEKFVPEGARTWAVSRFSADRGESQAALEQCQTLPMLSSQQVVFLEEAEAIEKLGEKSREEIVENIVAYLKDPAPFTILVIEAEKLDMRMILGKKLAEHTLVVDICLGDDPQNRLRATQAWAKTIAKEQGVTLESAASVDLAEYVSGDLMRLKTEMEKLTTFVGERKTIRREDVTLLVISEKTTTSWDLADLLASRQGSKALEFLNRLLREGEEPVLMVGAMAWTYRKLIEASEVRVTGPWQAASALRMPAERAEFAIRRASKVSRERLLDGLRALQDADNLLKGGAKDVRAVMEFLVWRLSGERAAAG
jgi:DNA polymerase III subunit delta